MPTLTDRLDLKRHTLADEFRIQDYADNWEALDDHPGVYICTSITRPTWGAENEGQFIFETDTLLTWRWTGAAWARLFANGLVARGERLTDISTSSTTYVVALSVNADVVAGDRRHLVIAEGPGVFNTNGLTEMALFRGATMLQEWSQQGWTGTDVQRRPRPLAITSTDLPTAATHAYTIQFRAVAGVGGTSTVIGATNKPLSLTIVEV